MRVPELSEEERKDALAWRLAKCGKADFPSLFKRFTEECRKKR